MMMMNLIIFMPRDLLLKKKLNDITIDINKAFAKYDYIYDISGTFWDENKGTNFDTYVSNNSYDIDIIFSSSPYEI